MLKKSFCKCKTTLFNYRQFWEEQGCVYLLLSCNCHLVLLLKWNLTLFIMLYMRPNFSPVHFNPQKLFPFHLGQYLFWWTERQMLLAFYTVLGLRYSNCLKNHYAVWARWNLPKKCWIGTFKLCFLVQFKCTAHDIDQFCIPNVRICEYTETYVWWLFGAVEVL